MTRTREQASQLTSALRDRGAEVVEVPVIEITDPADGGGRPRRAPPSDSTLTTGWWSRRPTAPGGCSTPSPTPARFGSARIAAIGPGTAAVLAQGRIVADLVPERYVAEALLAALPDGPGRLLLARAEVARGVLPDGLRARGWEVDVVEAYRTVPAAISDEQRAAVRGADLITFTSSSTVEHSLTAFGADGLPPAVACIGPITAATARQHGLAVDVEADVHTIDGLVDAVLRWAAP